MEPVTYIWMDGELVGWADANVHVLSHGLHYGTGVFEGIRAYPADGGTAVFRLKEHMDRLVASSRAYRIPLAWTSADLVSAAKELMRANRLEAGYIRPLVFYGTGSMGLNPAGAEVKTIMACWSWGAYLGEEGLENGIRVATSSWRRIDHTSLIPNAKGTGGYLNSVLAKQEALSGGYDEALLLNANGYIAEGSGENLFLVRGGVVRTPLWLAGALDGITRDTVITLLRDDGIEVVGTDLTRSDAYYADEAFFTGTAAEVTPIREIDNRPVGTGKPGPVTRRAQELFTQVVHGKLPEYERWLDYV